MILLRLLFLYLFFLQFLFCWADINIDQTRLTAIFLNIVNLTNLNLYFFRWRTDWWWYFMCWIILRTKRSFINLFNCQLSFFSYFIRNRNFFVTLSWNSNICAIMLSSCQSMLSNLFEVIIFIEILWATSSICDFIVLYLYFNVTIFMSIFDCLNTPLLLKRNT